MARTAIVPQVVTRAGLNPAYAAANVDGHSIPGDGRTIVHVKTVGTGCTVTLPFPSSLEIDGQAPANKTIVIGTNSERLIGPFPEVYKQSDGTVNIDFSAVTAVTVAAFKV